jgi:hypothetical protein
MYNILVFLSVNITMAPMAHGQQVVNRVKCAPGRIAQVMNLCDPVNSALLAGSAAALYGLRSDSFVFRVL